VLRNSLIEMMSSVGLKSNMSFSPLVSADCIVLNYVRNVNRQSGTSELVDLRTRMVGRSPRDRRPVRTHNSLNRRNVPAFQKHGRRLRPLSSAVIETRARKETKGVT
jgi:hypothetical protein